MPSSIGALVVDIDVKEGQDVQDEKTKVVEFLGKDRLWFEIPTPSGGLHCYFAYTGKYGNKKWSLGTASGDIRCNRGYVIVWHEGQFQLALDSWQKGLHRVECIEKSKIDKLCSEKKNGRTADPWPIGTRNERLNREVFTLTKNGLPVDMPSVLGDAIFPVISAGVTPLNVAKNTKNRNDR